ncbi:MAG: ribonuclease III [Chitinophagaceae bacterium]|nr:ribonuclease III [Anaerolineae bacterium]
MELNEFEEILSVKFNQPDLLRQALTHRSYINERSNEEIGDNERLEFLGDAILDFITADMLYTRFPDMPEGGMTRLRSALVRTEALAQMAIDCRLGEVLLIGKGEENSGGRERTNNLCRAFEAVVGAIYLDQGLDVVKGFIVPRLNQMQQYVMEAAIRKDARSQLQEWSQAAHSLTPIYRTVSSSGPDHEKAFIVEVSIGTKVITTGSGRSKQSAAQSAAIAALELLTSGRLEI